MIDEEVSEGVHVDIAMDASRAADVGRLVRNAAGAVVALVKVFLCTRS